jgi:hypothetical protein
MSNNITSGNSAISGPVGISSHAGTTRLSGSVGPVGSVGQPGLAGISEEEIKMMKRDITLSMLEGKYKCISAYVIPKDFFMWEKCPNCNLYPLVWEFNNGRSTACGCGENEYRHFSIHAESVMSYISRNNASALNYDSNSLRKNWNHWVKTGEILESHEDLIKQNKW